MRLRDDQAFDREEELERSEVRAAYIFLYLPCTSFISPHYLPCISEVRAAEGVVDTALDEALAAAAAAAHLSASLADAGAARAV